MYFDYASLMDKYKDLDIKVIKINYDDKVLKLHISLKNIVINNDPKVDAITYDHIIDLHTGKTIKIILDKIGFTKIGYFIPFDAYIFYRDNNPTVNSWLENYNNFVTEFNIPIDFSKCVIHNSDILNIVNDNLKTIFFGKIYLDEVEESLEEESRSFKSNLVILGQRDINNYIQFSYSSHMTSLFCNGVVIKVKLNLGDVKELCKYKFNKTIDLKVLFTKIFDTFRNNIDIISDYPQSIQDFVDICDRYL